jgi:hypothetical protein
MTAATRGAPPPTAEVPPRRLKSRAPAAAASPAPASAARPTAAIAAGSAAPPALPAAAAALLWLGAWRCCWSWSGRFLHFPFLNLALLWRGLPLLCCWCCRHRAGRPASAACPAPAARSAPASAARIAPAPAVSAAPVAPTIPWRQAPAPVTLSGPIPASPTIPSPSVPVHRSRAWAASPEAKPLPPALWGRMWRGRRWWRRVRPPLLLLLLIKLLGFVECCLPVVQHALQPLLLLLLFQGPLFFLASCASTAGHVKSQTPHGCQGFVVHRVDTALTGPQTTRVRPRQQPPQQRVRDGVFKFCFLLSTSTHALTHARTHTHTHTHTSPTKAECRLGWQPHIAFQLLGRLANTATAQAAVPITLCVLLLTVPTPLGRVR